MLFRSNPKPQTPNPKPQTPNPASFYLGTQQIYNMELHDISGHGDREKIELYVSCRNLVVRDMASKSDPYVIISMRTITGQWRVVGKTEIKWNHSDPDFAKSFIVDFIFERRQWVKIECRDADDPTGTQYDSLGQAEFELGYLIGAQNSTLALDLKEPEKDRILGKVVVRGEPKKDHIKDSVSMKFQGMGLAGMFLFMPERAFFTISKLVYRGEIATVPKKIVTNDSYNLVTNEKGEEWIAVYESELSSGANPNFPEIQVSLSKLCSGDMNTPLRFTLYVSRLCDNHKYKGEFQTTCEQLLAGPASFAFKDMTVNNSHAGTLQLISSKIVKEYMMIEYLRGGMQMALSVGIDFTASNMDPLNPSSLHYCNRGAQGYLNMYQQAILAVGKILLNYDQDKQVAHF